MLGAAARRKQRAYDAHFSELLDDGFITLVIDEEAYGLMPRSERNGRVAEKGIEESEFKLQRW